MSQHNGRFITLEGSEGVGKTTNMAVICQVLDSHGIAFVRTREPGGTPLAEALREAMLSQRDERVDGLTELLLVFAARKQHLDNVIRPALARGQWVICDRFTDASFAYQGYERGEALDRIEMLEQWVQDGLQPDLTLVLDLEPKVAERRMQERTKDRMESEQRDFYQRVRSGYLSRAETADRYQVVDAAQSIAAVATAVEAHVAALVDGWKSQL